MYFYLVSILLYILVCGYILIFSGSVFVEGIVKGWWHGDALDADSYALWWSGLTAFPCLFGIIGGIVVLSTETRYYFKIKGLLFIPSIVWSTELVLFNFRWGFQYWVQWLYLVPAMLVSMFILYCVIHQVRIPILPTRKHQAGQLQSSSGIAPSDTPGPEEPQSPSGIVMTDTITVSQTVITSVSRTQEQTNSTPPGDTP